MNIYRNKSIVVLFILFLAMFLPFYQASAQVSFETDEPTFDTNNPGLNVQDFQVVNVPTATFITCDTSPVNSASDNLCFSPGEILAGIEFFASPIEPDDIVVLGDSFGGSTNPPNILGNNTFAEPLEIGFTGTTNAVGLTIGCLASGTGTCTDTVTVSVFGATDNFLSSTNVAVTDAADAFIGVNSVDPISRISLDFLVPGGNLVKTIHEVKFDSTTVNIVDVNNGACALTKSNLNNIRVEGATPNKNVAIIMGLQYGLLTIGGNVCNGLELGVKQAQILALGKADSDGVLNAQSPVPPLQDTVSNAFFQVVDVATCTASEVYMYDLLIDEIQTNDDDGDGVVNCKDACPEQGLPNPMFDETLGQDGCIESPCEIGTEVSYNDRCYYLDGSGGACLPGYVLAPQSVLGTIAPGFIGKDYKTMVSVNCCIWHSDQNVEGQDWGMPDSNMTPSGTGVCNTPGPFELGPLLGGSGCIDSTNTDEAQLTLCVSQEIIID